MAQVGEEEDGNLGYADAGGAISEEVPDGVMGYADAGGAMAEEVTEWAEGSALEEDVVDVNEEGDMVWTDAGWFPALPSGAWDESAGEVLEWHEELAEPPRKTTRKEWRGSARELVPEHTTAPTTRMTSTWVDGGAYDIPPPLRHHLRHRRGWMTPPAASRRKHGRRSQLRRVDHRPRRCAQSSMRSRSPS